VLATDQQIAAYYAQAGLSPDGVVRLSQLGIAQRARPVALAEEFVAKHADNMLDQLMPACLARTDRMSCTVSRRIACHRNTVPMR